MNDIQVVSVRMIAVKDGLFLDEVIHVDNQSGIIDSDKIVMLALAAIGYAPCNWNPHHEFINVMNHRVYIIGGYSIVNFIPENSVII